MQKLQAQNIVKETLQNDFSKERFVIFIRELLNSYEEASFVYRGNIIPDAYDKYISTIERVGKYSDGESNIDILIVKLRKETSLGRARTAQRNFIAWYLNGSRGGKQKDAALVAFVSPNEVDWRFSLIKMDYKFVEGKNGKTKVKEEFTPARRWSFLVGPNEHSHTAQAKLAPIIEDENVITLARLEEAFNIEKVTREFFEKYRDLFLRTKEDLDELVKSDEKLKNDFQEKSVNTADFSKKLLGQIVFLYFLQKKGWFGVKQGKNWGTGSESFMRDLFEKKIISYKNFFNDVLEHLFYDALSRDRSDIDHFNPHFNCKIPFLNGGLFDPINGYSWEKTEINLPNDLFSNKYKDLKTGDEGNGILDIFDRYNFTVKEDEPLEKEVAVDPEMLGKVFENLLEVKDRKSKGTYYTPREIVHYMCEQSLVNYLATELEDKVGKEDIEKLIKIGESAIEHEAEVKSRGKETKTYSYKLPKSVRDNAKLIDEKLETIRICDPAVGSGAFPVGMMNEIIRTRNALTSYLKTKKGRTIYDFKRHAIQNSLYGVDIDPGAVEIAKLRLWLSLVVDEDDIKQIKPLPNLDYKIMQGNSLLEEFEGIKLFDEKLIAVVDTGKEKLLDSLKQKQAILQKEYFELHSQNKLTPAKQAELNSELKKLQAQAKKLNQPEKTNVENAGLFDMYSEAKKKADDLKRLHKEFFEATQKSKKDNIKKQIEQLEWELIEATLKEQGKTSALKKLEEFKRSNTKPFFLWKLNFADVFEEKGGFDVVIGNPPYGFRNVLTPAEKIYFRKVENIEFSSGDSAELFCKKSFNNLVRQDGMLTFIIPKKSLYGDAWDGFRKEYWLTYNLRFLLDSSKAFQDVLLEANAFGLAKNSINEDIKCAYLTKDDSVLEFASGNKGDIFLENATAQIYKLLIPKSLWQKIQDDKTNEHLVDGRLGLAIGTDFFSDKETDYKLLKGIDIARWKIKSHRWLKNKSKLNWDSVKEFLKPKVICQRLIAHIENPKPHIKITACYDKEGIIITNTLMSFELNNKLSREFWLAYLNSEFVSWYVYNFVYARAIRSMDFYNFYFQQIPIPQVVLEKNRQNDFIALINQIQKIVQSADYSANTEKQAKVHDLEHQIDELVYKLYGLTDEEIKIVEAKI